MTRARRWWFEVERENDAVFVIFDYKGKGPSKLIPKKKNTPYSAVRKLETYDDSTHADKDLVKIVFSIPDEHPCKLSRSSFTWNKSEFSRKLRDFQTPVDFAEECNRLLKELRSKSTESGETSTSPCSSVSVSSNEELSDEEDDMDVEEDCPSIEGNSLISHTPRKPGTKKRKRLCEQAKTLVIPSLTKRQKVQEKVAQTDEETEAMKRSIRNCHIGTYLISIGSLEVGKQIRDVQEKWVKQLQTYMEDYYNEAYQPLVVVLKGERKQTFRDTNVNGYSYEVIGGQHSFLAVKSLAEKYPEREELQSRYAVVYAELTEEQRLWLANQHNITMEQHNKMCFTDKVKVCRKLHEEMGNEDDKTPWEKTCAMILKEKVDSAMMQSIFEISSMDENYELMMSVIEMYEDGATKGQKLKGEELRNRPVLPHTKLRDFFSIKTEDQCLLLENVLDSTMTFADMCKEASILKKLDLVQRSFCQQTHCLDGGWEEAVERFPREATRERLEEFTKLSFSRGIPDSFVNYCQRLLRLEKHEDGLKNAAAYSKNGTYAFSVPETISNLNTSILKEQCPGFSGIDLTLIDMPKDWSVEDINRLVVMIKAINRDSQKKMYNIALVCDVAHISEVLAVLKKEKNCFVQPAFCHVENGIRGQNSGLVDSVQCVAVAYFGDSKRYLENFSSTEQNIWSTKTDRTSGHKPEGLYSQMITWFSHPGEWVLHFSDNESATGILAAVEVRRHCIFASGDMDHLAIIQDVLNAVMDMETEPDEN